MIASRQPSRVEAAAATARAKRDYVENLHLCAGRVALVGSHMRRSLADQFHAPCSTHSRGLRVFVGCTKEPNDDSAIEDVQAEVEDAMQVMD